MVQYRSFSTAPNQLRQTDWTGLDGDNPADTLRLLLRTTHHTIDTRTRISGLVYLLRGHGVCSSSVTFITFSR